MKAIPLKLEDGTYEQVDPSKATHVALQFPGPLPRRMIPVILKGTRRNTGFWSWNGDVDAPTLHPSILTRGKRDLTDEETDMVLSGSPLDLQVTRCHSFVNNGRVKFLDDSSHELAGRELPLEDVDWF